MTYDFFLEAKEEFIEAAVEYENKQSGLGWRFREEIECAIDWIVRNPFTLRERPGGYRRFNCPVFRHYLAYIVRNGSIYIVAVAHGHRSPDYWRARLQKP